MKAHRRTVGQKSWSCRLAIVVATQLLTVPAWSQPDAGTLRGHEGAVMMGLFTPDNGHTVTVSIDQTARFWSASDGALLRTYSQHTGPIYSLAVSQDGRTLVTGAQDNTLRVWDLPLPAAIEWHSIAEPTPRFTQRRTPKDALFSGVRFWNSRSKHLWGMLGRSLLHSSRGTISS